jgi:DNA polymerase-3 subunit alpha
MSFVPLHIHSDYSLLDGASQLPELVDRAIALGMKAIAQIMVSCMAQLN